MSKITKAAINVGYTEYVVDLREAVAIAEILSGAEIYKSRYKDGTTTQSITPMTQDQHAITMRIFSDNEYRLFKLAGEIND